MQWVGVYFYTPRMGYCRSMSNYLSKAVTHDQSHNVLGTKKGKQKSLYGEFTSLRIELPIQPFSSLRAAYL